MKTLNRPKFSILGWSDCGVIALVIADLVWGANAYVSDEDVNILKSVRDVKKRTARMREPLEKVYGAERFAEIWDEWTNHSGNASDRHVNMLRVMAKAERANRVRRTARLRLLPILQPAGISKLIDSSPFPSPVSFMLVPPPSPGKAPKPSKPAFEPARNLNNECMYCSKVQEFTDSVALNLMHISYAILNKVSLRCISISKYNPFQDGMVITYRSNFKARESNKI
uniref:Uncharacterized protein n=1 Tax=Glossina palpalis gambiensis TaxID=67801 RepID=A0A1B0C0I9_9MUSC